MAKAARVCPIICCTVKCFRAYGKSRDGTLRCCRQTRGRGRSCYFPGHVRRMLVLRSTLHLGVRKTGTTCDLNGF